MSMMPVLYVPRTRYTGHTHVLVPVLVTFMRATAIVMLEWLSLRFADNAPLSLCVATGIFAIAVLAVLQSKDWLDFKGEWYFRGSLLVLTIAWIAVVAYGWWEYPPRDKIIPTFPTADELAAAIVQNLPKAPVTPPSVSFIPVPRGPNPDEPAKSGPTYLSAINLGPGDAPSPIILNVTIAVNVPRLRVFVDWWKSGSAIRVHVADLEEPSKGEQKQFTLISERVAPNPIFWWGGGDRDASNFLYMTPDPALLQPIRIVVVGPDGEEQRQDATLIIVQPRSTPQIMIDRTQPAIVHARRN